MIKQAFNVLYRRILYKIPFKFLLILLALFAVCFASFSKAELLSDFGWVAGTSVGGATQFGGTTKTTCFYTPTGPESDGCGYSFDGTNYSSMGGDNLICVYGLFYMRCTNRSHTFRIFSTENIVASSSKCQSSYSLIPVSSVNQNYCTTNNLCPTCPTCEECEECPVCPVGSGGVSSLYINDILHIGSPFIYMTIPQELSWDYEYTQGGTNMNIDIEGYNVDYEYMDGVVDIQNYKPNGEDLTNLVSSVLPLFVPGLVIILFLYFIFRFIKKIF